MPHNYRKVAILDALERFAEQRPGIEPGNYGDWRAYRRESAQVTRDLRHVRTLAAAVMRHPTLDAEYLLSAARGGRLTIEAPADAVDAVQVRVGYTTGQYFPTEYRRAVARVLAGALWDWTRENAMPAPRTAPDGQEFYPSLRRRSGFVSGGDWLREHFAREFGRCLGNLYFD